MTSCPPFNSRSVVITSENYDEPLPQQYSTAVGTQITASCNTGYQLVGTKSFRCESNGKWSYGNTPPSCVVDATTATPTEAAPDENTWILIGVVCGVAAIIIAILVIMMVAIWYRDRKRNKREELMMFNINRMYPPDYPGYGQPSPYNRDEEIEVYDRPKSPVPPPPPYETGSRDEQERQHYIKHRDRDYERHRNFDRYRDRNPYYEKKARSREYLSDVGRRSFHDYGERRSGLSSRMYLPEREDERDWETEPKSLYSRSRSFDDLSDRGRRRYEEPWVRRSYRNDAFDDTYDMFYKGPRDYRIWRNA